MCRRAKREDYVFDPRETNRPAPEHNQIPQGSEADDNLEKLLVRTTASRIGRMGTFFGGGWLAGSLAERHDAHQRPAGPRGAGVTPQRAALLHAPYEISGCSADARCEGPAEVHNERPDPVRTPG